MKKLDSMRRLLTGAALLAGMFLFCGTLAAQEKGTYTDKRDGQVYTFARIGKKVWMLENLNFVTPAGSWIAANDTVHQSAYGRQYDYATALKACPKGWALPTAADWDAMIVTQGGVDEAAAKLMAMDSVVTRFKPAKAGTLSALLAGVRHADGSVSGAGMWGGFWSATATPESAVNYLFAKGNNGISKSTNDKASAFTVRCIRSK